MRTGEPVRTTCPVCTGTLCDQLPNEQRVVEEQVDVIDDLRTASDVTGACEFDHYSGEDNSIHF